MSSGVAIPAAASAAWRCCTCRFTSKGPDRGDCDTALLAYSAGHELATHTVTHPELPGLCYDEITAEVAGQREWLIDCGIPAEAITGFRAPYYKTDDTVTQVGEGPATGLVACSECCRRLALQ